MPSLFNARFIQVHIIPGAVLQSVMVGGGYGAGREIVEYFTSFRILGGLLALGISFAVVVIVLALAFELARVSQVYDYRNFFKQLLCRGWTGHAISASQ